jgi:hypothetical protein
MLGLNSDGEDFFNFEAASSDTIWDGTNKNLAQQTQTIQAEEAIHVMPLTKSEVEAILASRAADAQDFQQTYSLAPPELDTDCSGFGEASPYGARFNYNGTGIPTSPNFNDFDMLEYGNTSPNVLGGFRTFEQLQFEEQAEAFGALTACGPAGANQSA